MINMADSKTQTKRNRTSILRSHTFQKLYCTNLIGGGTKYDFRFELFNEKIKSDTDKEWLYVSDALVILTPQAAKKLYSTLNKYVKEYEKDHGTIEDPDPLEKNEGLSAD